MNVISPNMFSPWIDDVRFNAVSKKVSGQIASNETKCWMLWCGVKQAIESELEGEFWECGVFRGGSAAIIADGIRDKQATLRLFDTFTGIPYKDDMDLHRVGDFSNTSVDFVKQIVGYDKAVIHKGVIPLSFEGLESSKVVFCHVDVDMYRSVKACCAFVWPRLVVGGVMVFDDYAITSCPGARYAMDEFFAGKRGYVVQGVGGSAVVVKPPQDGDVVVKPPKGWAIEFKSPLVREWSLGRLKISWKGKD